MSEERSTLPEPSTPVDHEIEKLLAQSVWGHDVNFEKREDFLIHLEASRREMEALLETILPSREIYPGWTKKEIVSHLTGWEDGSLESVRAMLAGNPPVVPRRQRGPDYYNAQSVLERADLTFEQVVREWRMARQQFCALVSAMTPEQFATPLIFPWGLNGTVTDAILGLLSHEQEHIHQIRSLLE